MSTSQIENLVATCLISLIGVVAVGHGENLGRLSRSDRRTESKYGYLPSYGSIISSMGRGSGAEIGASGPARHRTVGLRSGCLIEIRPDDVTTAYTDLYAIDPNDPERAMAMLTIKYHEPEMGYGERLGYSRPMHYVQVDAPIEVEPEDRGKGVASDLWDALEQYLEQQYGRDVLLDPNGFSEEGEKWWEAYQAKHESRLTYA